MIIILSVIYSVFASSIIYVVFAVGSLFNDKIKQGFLGRIGALSRLRKYLATVPPEKKIIFIHSSSVGEWEQSVQIIRQLKKKHEDLVIVASFFSPSGYNIVRSDVIDYKLYLPFDDVFHAWLLFRQMKPAVWIISKYDVWPVLLFSAKLNHIPVILASAELAEDSTRHRGLFRIINRFIYSRIDHILTVSDEYAQRFRLIVSDPEKIQVTGDARYDQIFQKALSYSEQPLSNIYANAFPTMICGSTWPADEAVIVPAMIAQRSAKLECNFVIVPHEIHERHISSLEAQLDAHGIRHKRFTQLSSNEQLSSEILIVDTIGQLAKLYRQGSFAYIGGSFGSGVHNVLEPAAYGLPLLFGPRHKNSYEAKQLLATGGADLVTTVDSAFKLIAQHVQNPQMRTDKGIIAKNFLSSNLGAAQRTVSVVEQYMH